MQALTFLRRIKGRAAASDARAGPKQKNTAGGGPAASSSVLFAVQQ
jgi:hypothetical protein